MAICNNCGTEIPDHAAVCPSCGASQGAAGQPAGDDNGGFGWGLLGFCIPIAGLILFLVWKDTKPNTAKAAGMGALVAVIISAVFYIISIIAGVGAATMSSAIINAGAFIL